MGPKKLFGQLGYRMNEYLFNCLICTISRPRKAAGKIKLPGKEYAAYGEAASPLGAFSPLLWSTAFTWEQRHKNELDLNRLRSARTIQLDWAWEQTWT